MRVSRGLVFFLFLALALNAAAVPSWTQHDVNTTSARQWVRAVDIDADGDMDILSTDPNAERVTLHVNDGSMGFSAGRLYGYISGQAALDFADLDLNGLVDVVANTGYTSFGWYNQLANNDFNSWPIYPHGSGSPGFSSAQAIDLDKDGDMDIVASVDNCCGATDYVRWFENNGDQNFAFYDINKLADINPMQIFAIDLDGDGDIDILTPSAGSFISWYKNGGAQNFTHVPIALTSGASSVTVRAADFDGDGDIDIITQNGIGCCSSTDPMIGWLENDGAENFTVHVLALRTVAGDAVRDVWPVDLDNDGDMDVLFSERYAGRVAWLDNNGMGNDYITGFTMRNIVTGITHVYGVYPADMDGDGDYDVLSAYGPDNDYLRWFESDLNGTSKTVSAPSGTSVKLNSPTGSDYSAATTVSIFSVLFGADPFIDVGCVGNCDFSNATLVRQGAGNRLFFDSVTDDANVFHLVKKAYVRHHRGQTLYWCPDAKTIADVNASCPNKATVSRGGRSLQFVHPDENKLYQVAVTNQTINSTRYWVLHNVPNQGGGGGGISWTQHDFNQNLQTMGYIDLGDFDGDGDIDVAAMNDSAGTTQMRLHINRGDGNFSVGTTINDSTSAGRTIVVGDVDMDKDLDFAGASDGSGRAWWRNDGSYSFTVQDVGTTVDDEWQLIDVDEDGDMDWVSNGCLGVCWYKNNGSQSFTEQTFGDWMTNTTMVDTVDLDSDGDFDMIRRGDSTLKWYSNNGSESFTQFTIDSSLDNDNHRGSTTCDLDGDGDIDIITNVQDDGNMTWYENNGSETFTERLLSNTPYGNAVNEVVCIDYDFDNDMDVISVTRNSTDANVVFHDNNGSQSFTDIVAYSDPSPGEGAWTAKVADLDGDGDLDIAVSKREGTSVADVYWLKSDLSDQNKVATAPSGTTMKLDSPTGPAYGGESRTESIFSVLINSKPAVDVACASTCNFSTASVATGSSTVFFDGLAENAGVADLVKKAYILGEHSSSIFWCPNATSPSDVSSACTGVVTADANNQVLTFKHPDTNRFYEVSVTQETVSGTNYWVLHNVPYSGGGGWSPITWTSSLVTGSVGGEGVKPVDLDADGDIDLVVADFAGDAVYWYQNNGSESFTQKTIVSSVDGPRWVDVADVDLDGDFDVLAAHFNADTIAWYENLGGATSWTDHNLSTTYNGANYIGARDIDGDGDYDLVATSEMDDKLAWWENDGAQSFTQTSLSTTLTDSNHAVIFDVDHDGDIDIVNVASPQLSKWVNNGSETFTQSNVTSSGSHSKLYYEDVDSDGDYDLITVKPQSDSIHWYSNSAGTFTGNTLSTGNMARPSYALAADLDGDKDTDIVSLSAPGTVISWHSNNGSESFTDYNVSASIGGRVAAAVDVDDDGDLDLVTSSDIGPSLYWFASDIGDTNKTVTKAFSTTVKLGSPGGSVYAGETTLESYFSIFKANEPLIDIGCVGTCDFSTADLNRSGSSIYVGGVTNQSKVSGKLLKAYIRRTTSAKTSVYWCPSASSINDVNTSCPYMASVGGDFNAVMTFEDPDDNRMHSVVVTRETVDGNTFWVLHDVPEGGGGETTFIPDVNITAPSGGDSYNKNDGNFSAKFLVRDFTGGGDEVYADIYLSSFAGDFNSAYPVVLDLNLARTARFPSLDANCTGNLDYNNHARSFFNQQVTCFYDVNPSIVADGNWFLDINASDKDANIGIDSTPQQAAGTEDGLISAWNFNEGSGTTTADVNTTGARNGTLTNGPRWDLNFGGSPVEGYDLNFNGKDGGASAVTVGSQAIFNNMAQFSAMAWVYPLPAANDFPTFLSKGFGACNPVEGWYLGYSGYGAGGPFRLRLDYTTSDLYVEPSPSLGVSKWRHVALTWDGSSTASNAKFYWNGVEPAYATQSDASGSRVSDSAQNLFLGSGSTGSSSPRCGWGGRIDDIRIYNRVLTAAEVKQISGAFEITSAVVDTTAPDVNVSLPAGGETFSKSDGNFVAKFLVRDQSDSSFVDEVTVDIYLSDIALDLNTSNTVVVDLNLARIARFPSLDANCTATTDYNSAPTTFFNQQVTCFYDVDPTIVVDDSWFLDVNASDKAFNSDTNASASFDITSNSTAAPDVNITLPLGNSHYRKSDGNFSVSFLVNDETYADEVYADIYLSLFAGDLNTLSPVVLDLNLARTARFPSLDANCTASTDYNSSPATFFGQQVTCFYDVNPNIVVDGNWFVDVNASDKSGNIVIDSTPQQNALQANLLSGWRFNEGTGLFAYDTNTTGARDGNMTGHAPTWLATSPVEGTALDFDGNDDNVNVPYNFYRDKVSLTAWVRPFFSYAGPGCGNGDFTVFDNFAGGGSGTIFDLTYQGGCSVEHKYRARYRNNFGSVQEQYGPQYDSNSQIQHWTHLAMTEDKDTGLKLYINGSIAGTNLTTTGSGSVATYGNIGRCISCTVPGLIWRGYIDEVAVWDKFLSKKEVRQQSGVLLINTTNNAPTVSSVAPTSAGQSCDGSASETYNITWTSDDVDLDDLNFTLYYDTTSGGKTNQIVTGLSQEDVSCEAPEDTSCSYTWSCPDTDGDFYITVTANDGMDSTDGTSSNTLNIIPEFGAVALALAVLAALGILLRRRLLA